jgi:hypothetical protein
MFDSVPSVRTNLNDNALFGILDNAISQDQKLVVSCTNEGEEPLRTLQTVQRDRTDFCKVRLFLPSGWETFIDVYCEGSSSPLAILFGVADHFAFLRGSPLINQSHAKIRHSVGRVE